MVVIVIIFLKNMLKSIALLLGIVISFPLIVLNGIRVIIIDIFKEVNILYLKKRKYNEKKIKRKLYIQIYRILALEKEINLCEDFAISKEEYKSYTTLKYLFTRNKDTFTYRKDADKYLYNFYDFNAHKDMFIEKWIKEVKEMLKDDECITIEETFIEDCLEESSLKKILKISLVEK